MLQLIKGNADGDWTWKSCDLCRIKQKRVIEWWRYDKCVHVEVNPKGHEALSDVSTFHDRAAGTKCCAMSGRLIEMARNIGV